MSQRVISFHYKVANDTGQVLDSSDGADPIAFLEGSGQIVPGLEQEIILLKVGDKREVKVGAKDGYGIRDESLLVRARRDQFPNPDVKVGDMFRGDEEEDSPVFTVVEITTDDIALDGNHPLAGQNLVFNIEVTGIRPATAEEMAHGHAHGEGGHHH